MKITHRGNDEFEFIFNTEVPQMRVVLSKADVAEFLNFLAWQHSPVLHETVTDEIARPLMYLLDATMTSKEREIFGPRMIFAETKEGRKELRGMKRK